MPSPNRAARAARRSSAIRTKADRPHHAQARISDEAARLLAQLAAELGVSESEVVRDALYARLFGSPPGSTMQGPDEGYRIAKSTAGVIARRALAAAMAELPDDWETFARQMEET